MKRINFTITAIFLLFNVFITEAGAINLSLAQGKVRLSIPPGGIKTGIINLRNTSSDPIAIRAYLEDWYYLPAADGTKEFKPAGVLPFSCASWISFSPAEFTIPAYGKQEVNYAVKAPFNAKGGHYAVLFFETILRDPSVEEGFGLGVSARIGSLFYIEPAGTIQRQIKIENFSLSREIEDAPLMVNIDIKNIGNVDITASGSFHIIDRAGMVYARGEFNKVYTFPNDKAIIKGEWQKPIPAGRYDLVITLDLGKALEETGMGRGPTVVKEAKIRIGSLGEVVSADLVR